jgi:hypothetical protein
MSQFPDISGFISPGKVPKVKSKVLAQLLPTIEAALQAGYVHDQIHAWLAENGLDLDRKYYHDAIYRLRKQRNLGSLRSSGAPMRVTPAITAISSRDAERPLKAYMPIGAYQVNSASPKRDEQEFALTPDNLLF